MNESAEEILAGENAVRFELAAVSRLGHVCRRAKFYVLAT